MATCRHRGTGAQLYEVNSEAADGRGVGGCGASAVSWTRRPGSLADVAGGWRAATHRYGAHTPAVLP